MLSYKNKGNYMLLIEYFALCHIFLLNIPRLIVAWQEDSSAFKQAEHERYVLGGEVATGMYAIMVDYSSSGKRQNILSYFVHFPIPHGLYII